MVIDFFIALFGTAFLGASGAAHKIGRALDNYNYQFAKKQREQQWEERKRIVKMKYRADEEIERKCGNEKIFWDTIEPYIVDEFGEDFFAHLKSDGRYHGRSYFHLRVCLEFLCYSHFGKCPGTAWRYEYAWCSKGVDFKGTNVEIRDAETRIMHIAEGNLRKYHPGFKLYYERNNPYVDTGYLYVGDSISDFQKEHSDPW